ncbi:MAG: radical SAM protein [Candidatus Woesebacteria bacterium]|jgi:MoaA/NifB/PqqE/SkfB family radical SAM enzyme
MTSIKEKKAKKRVRQYIDQNIVKKVYSNKAVDKVAWVVGSTPPPLTIEMERLRYKAPHHPSLKEIFKARTRLAAEMYLTRTCALNCLGCSVPTYIRWGKEEKRTCQEWQKLIIELKERGLKAVKFIGGEVGFIPWLPDVVKTALNHDLVATVFTDGIPFLRKPERLERLYELSDGKVILYTSLDFLPPRKKLTSKAALNPETSRAYKAQEALKFIDQAIDFGFPVVAHMMVFAGNYNLIEKIYQKVTQHGAKFSIGTMQVDCHLYQGRNPKNYAQALTKKHRSKIKQQMLKLLKIEDKNVKAGRRTFVNSRAHLASLHTEGINPKVDCNNRLGPPAVFAVMPNHDLRHCPVIQTLDQVKQCQGCSYAVFRDSDPERAKFLKEKGIYKPKKGVVDFPSLIYPTEENNQLEKLYE